jgi:hypothetical protein
MNRVCRLSAVFAPAPGLDEGASPDCYDLQDWNDSALRPRAMGTTVFWRQ